ncbi:hypothetical protein AKJ38_02070 [candidate division MSBL1 archaeon SCGC-AAA259I14]|uniref:Uncharacterized protein n=1 Tax=candidate division MSBL1 archaeon SCGC-AAA259I14 TaxID=1698268 RepID=A0A133US36_9EURY|nr:hypothetical protein AKJ38_02070 [candidate division MSBL1 archaeon SCGC-AAA259I14]
MVKSSSQETLLTKNKTKTIIRQLKDKSENGKGYFYTYTKKTYIPIIYGGGSLTPPSFGIGGVPKQAVFCCWRIPSYQSEFG